MSATTQRTLKTEPHHHFMVRRKEDGREERERKQSRRALKVVEEHGASKENELRIVQNSPTSDYLNHH